MFQPSVGEVLLLADKAAGAGSPSLFQTLALFGAIAAIMYVFIFMPQQKEKKAHEAMVAALAKDDRVVISSGIHGRVVSVSEQTVVVEIADRTRVTVDKAAIARKAAEPDGDKK